MKPIVTVGKCSTFGGADDTGVAPHEGLSLVLPSQMRHAAFRALFRERIDQSLGAARNLDPDALYCAMRWNYKVTPVEMLAQSIVEVTSESGRVCWVRPVDWGPNIRTGRVIDLSPGAARALSVKTDDTVQCVLITPETLFLTVKPPLG